MAGKDKKGIYMDYSTFLDRLTRWKIDYTRLSKISQLSVSTISRHVSTGKRLPGEAIYAIAEELQLMPDEISLELLGIEPRTEKPKLSDNDLIEMITRRIKT